MRDQKKCLSNGIHTNYTQHKYIKFQRGVLHEGSEHFIYYLEPSWFEVYLKFSL